MKKTHSKSISTPDSEHLQTHPPLAGFSQEPFVNAEQASAALNLPLYFFINTQKRTSLGLPHYIINRMVRYRIGELHQWQVMYSAQASLSQTGGSHA
jgi:hypothetical protein